jgi:hypothetical protein
MLAEMDSNVGQMLDAVDRLGLRDDTLVIFTSDNGPEFFKPWDGWAGPWRGQYFTALEGGIRVPFLDLLAALLHHLSILSLGLRFPLLVLELLYLLLEPCPRYDCLHLCLYNKKSNHLIVDQENKLTLLEDRHSLQQQK